MMTQAQNMLSLIQTAYSENPTTPNKASLGPTNLELNKIVQVRAQLWLHDSCTPISSTCFNKYTEQKDPSIFTDMLCVSQKNVLDVWDTPSSAALFTPCHTLAFWTRLQQPLLHNRQYTQVEIT